MTAEPQVKVNEEWQYRLEIQERALEVITRELQENISQSLCLAKLQLDFIAETPEEKVQQKIDDAGRILFQVIQDLKILLRQNIPDEILRSGFITGIKNEILIKEKLHGNQVALLFSGEVPPMAPSKELLIFCMIQDIINDNFNSLEQLDSISTYCEKNEIRFEITRNPGKRHIKVSNSVRSKAAQLQASLSVKSGKKGNILHLLIHI